MKKVWILCLFLALLILVGCGTNRPTTPTVITEEPEATTTLLETSPIPENLVGMWRSIDPGELDMVETIELTVDGNISVNCTYQGSDAGTIYGTYYIVGETLHCDMTSNGEPYILDYRYEIDGRELVLRSDAKTAHYIKVS